MRFFGGDVLLNAMLKNYDGYIPSVVYGELIQGENTSRKEVRIIKSYVSRFTMLHVTEAISKKAIQLLEKYSPSHNLKVGDAFIAATAFVRDYSLYTFNTKDFQYIPGLDLL